MKFPALRQGTLVKRYKRFLADIRLPDGKVITVHCPNTGAMKGCATPGWRAWYSVSDNRARKYPGTWELVMNEDGHYIGVNTANANRLVHEALNQGWISELSGYRSIRAEQLYGRPGPNHQSSRVDFLLSGHARRKADCFVEVKSVTLLTDTKSEGATSGTGQFPDAVTDRGTRHLKQLMAVKASGGRAVLLYCVQHTGIGLVRPAWQVDPVYAHTLKAARAAGVEVLAYGVRMDSDGAELVKRLPVRMGRG
ncbi:MAG: DNA/RNA nuclease SfsA [Gammaproteobacteria bacterium]|nr:DNA/RNA nuclease SfsA [Gammaproteobacteria bacterium]